MPQMAPILWDLMSFVSLALVLTFLAKIYFFLKMQEVSSKKTDNSFNLYKMNWKW